VKSSSSDSYKMNAEREAHSSFIEEIKQIRKHVLQHGDRAERISEIIQLYGPKTAVPAFIEIQRMVSALVDLVERKLDNGAVEPESMEDEIKEAQRLSEVTNLYVNAAVQTAKTLTNAQWNASVQTDVKKILKNLEKTTNVVKEVVLPEENEKEALKTRIRQQKNKKAQDNNVGDQRPFDSQSGDDHHRVIGEPKRDDETVIVEQQDGDQQPSVNVQSDEKNDCEQQVDCEQKAGREPRMMVVEQQPSVNEQSDEMENCEQQVDCEQKADEEPRMMVVEQQPSVNKQSDEMENCEQQVDCEQKAEEELRMVIIEQQQLVNKQNDETQTEVCEQQQPSSVDVRKEKARAGVNEQQRSLTNGQSDKAQENEQSRSKESLLKSRGQVRKRKRKRKRKRGSTYVSNAEGPYSDDPTKKHSVASGYAITRNSGLRPRRRRPTDIRRHLKIIASHHGKKKGQHRWDFLRNNPLATTSNRLHQLLRVNGWLKRHRNVLKYDSATSRKCVNQSVVFEKKYQCQSAIVFSEKWSKPVEVNYKKRKRKVSVHKPFSNNVTAIEPRLWTVLVFDLIFDFNLMGCNFETV
jgi:hypothetical protein